MSIDFDSTTLPIQHAEEEYDKEDYEREQEVNAQPTSASAAFPIFSKIHFGLIEIHTCTDFYIILKSQGRFCYSIRSWLILRLKSTFLPQSYIFWCI